MKYIDTATIQLIPLETVKRTPFRDLVNQIKLSFALMQNDYLKEICKIKDIDPTSVDFDTGETIDTTPRIDISSGTISVRI